jgi:hypothetical protein
MYISGIQDSVVYQGSVWGRKLRFQGGCWIAIGVLRKDLSGRGGLAILNVRDGDMEASAKRRF